MSLVLSLVENYKARPCCHAENGRFDTRGQHKCRTLGHYSKVTYLYYWNYWIIHLANTICEHQNGVWTSKMIDRVEKMRLEDKNNSQKMIIEYFANTKSVFAEFLRVHGMSKIVFGVRMVFANKRKRSYIFDVTPWFSMWTRQGLNLWPPDYESVALTNWATSPEKPP